MMEHMQNLETNINMNNLPNYTYTENQNKKNIISEHEITIT